MKPETNEPTFPRHVKDPIARLEHKSNVKIAILEELNDEQKLQWSILLTERNFNRTLLKYATRYRSNAIRKVQR